MTLEAAFLELEERLDHLERTLENVLWAVVQGQPEAEQGHTLVDYYDAVTTDFIGLVKDAKTAAEEGRKATRRQLDLAGARQALMTCQDLFRKLSGRLYEDVVSFERIEALNNLAREKGGEWARWVEGVKDALSQYPQPLHDVSTALFACWQDLTESASLLPVAVRSAPTGSQSDHAQNQASGEPQHGTNKCNRNRRLLS
jgi:hypothetical protein